jgi:hypothetical protein
LVPTPDRRDDFVWVCGPGEGFGVTDIWSPAPQIPPANPGTTALVKGVQKMGIQMDRMAGGHGGVGNFADLAKTVP